MNEKIKNNSLSELEKSNVIILNKQKKIALIVLLLICFFASIYFAYQDEINSPFLKDITIISKDGTQKMSLMNKDTKYSGPNSCPKGYHIPTAYERRKLGKLWCESHQTCDDNGYIGYEGTFIWYGDNNKEYNTEGRQIDYYEIQKFFHDVNIHLKKHFNFGAGFYKSMELGIRKHNSYCEALEANDRLNGHVSFSVDYYSLVDCYKEPKYVRCFSDENLTSEFIDEKDFSSEYGLQRTKFEIDGTIYSGRKVTSMPRGDVVIPDSFVGIPIIEVGGGLYGNITSVKLGNNIIKIDSDAFASNGIKEIEFPNSILYIGDYAFLNNQLNSVKFSDNLLYIGEHAFDNNQLTSIKLSDTVRFIGTWAFGGNKITSFKIPNGIKEISPEILRNNNLESIEIPEGVETIGDLAFYGNDLKEISLPQSLKTIGKSAFSCNNLTEILLPKSIEIIGNLAFCGNETGRESNLKGIYCGENGYVLIKGHSKDTDACININPFRVCRDEEDNRVCGKNGRKYRNLCHMRAVGDEENLNYEFVDGKCVLKKG